MFSFACAIVELIKQEYIHHYFLNNETRVQKENFGGIFSCFEVIFVQNGTFKMIRRLPRPSKRRLFPVGFRYVCKVLKYNLLLNPQLLEKFRVNSLRRKIRELWS